MANLVMWHCALSPRIKIYNFNFVIYPKISDASEEFDPVDIVCLEERK